MSKQDELDNQDRLIQPKTNWWHHFCNWCKHFWHKLVVRDDNGWTGANSGYSIFLFTFGTDLSRISSITSTTIY